MSSGLAPAVPSLILASTSPARRALMDSLAIPYRVEAPGVPEDFPSDLGPSEAVLLLARRKAQAVQNRFPEAVVIGSDQLASWRGLILGKPEDRDQARRQLSSLRGQTHDISTGLAVLGPNFARVELDVAQVTFHDIRDDELERCLDLEEWRGCAGGYRIESSARALLSSLTGDVTGVQGLPLQRLVRILREAGVPFFTQLPR